MSVEFKEFPKMARLSRDIIITEKIDGTNASIFIQQEVLEEGHRSDLVDTVEYQGTKYTIRAGSRTKWVTVGDDNHGFAGWVKANSKELVKLGEGHHFGEWWGSGIQRGYGLQKGEKRFSLFNVSRWKSPGSTYALGTEETPKCCGTVPVLYTGPFTMEAVENALDTLKNPGSLASPGFMKAEGVIVWHTAANIGFKKTIEKDDTPKSLQ